MTADDIIASAAAHVAGLHDPLERLARHVGILQGHVRSLCYQRDAAIAEWQELARGPMTDEERAEAARDEADDWKREEERNAA